MSKKYSYSSTSAIVPVSLRGVLSKRANIRIFSCRCVSSAHLKVAAKQRTKSSFSRSSRETKSPSASSSKNPRPRLLAIFLTVASSAMSATDPAPGTKKFAPVSARRINARTDGSLSYRSIKPRRAGATDFMSTQYAAIQGDYSSCALLRSSIQGRTVSCSWKVTCTCKVRCPNCARAGAMAFCYASLTRRRVHLNNSDGFVRDLPSGSGMTLVKS